MILFIVKAILNPSWGSLNLLMPKQIPRYEAQSVNSVKDISQNQLFNSRPATA